MSFECCHLVPRALRFNFINWLSLTHHPSTSPIPQKQNLLYPKKNFEADFVLGAYRTPKQGFTKLDSYRCVGL